MIEVYYNLHKLVWSVRTTNPCKVINHCRFMWFPTGGQFVVRPAGRARVLSEQRKNVHAFVRGYGCVIDAPESIDPAIYTGVTYNPYKFSTFVDISTHAPILETSNPIIMVAIQDSPPRVYIKQEV